MLSSALLLQLSLAASGTLCRMQGDPAMQSMDAAHEMHGPMHDSSKPCSTPSAPTGCASMAACAIGASVPAASAAPVAVSAPAAVVVAAPIEMPFGPVFAPELPPPRA